METKPRKNKHSKINFNLLTVLRIRVRSRIRIRRIRMLLGPLDTDPLVGGTSIIKQR
jgi:hypothetical protein